MASRGHDDDEPAKPQERAAQVYLQHTLCVCVCDVYYTQVVGRGLWNLSLPSPLSLSLFWCQRRRRFVRHSQVQSRLRGARREREWMVVVDVGLCADGRTEPKVYVYNKRPDKASLSSCVCAMNERTLEMKTCPYTRRECAASTSSRATYT